jgi:hypothetical protein
MYSPFFKTQMPNNIIYNLLENITITTDKYYIINNASYKKGIYLNIIKPFIEECRPYYQNTKLHYLNKKITYNSFLTIIRQICNENNIPYTSKIIYDKSTYDIVYFIYKQIEIN